MALHQIEERGAELTQAMIAFGEAVEWLHTIYQSGEILIRHIDSITSAQARAGEQAALFLIEAQKNPAVAEARIKVQQGDAETLTSFQQSVTNMHTVGGAWSGKMRAVIKTLNADTLAGFEIVTRSGVQTYQRNGLRVLPETAALELKNSPELAALYSALVQYGAITP